MARIYKRFDKLALLIFPNTFKAFFSVLGLTCKTKWHGREHIEKLKADSKPWIYSTWHNNVSTGTWVIRGQNIGIMISDSKDGEMVNQCVRKFGNYGIRGSSSRGASKATREALKTLRAGNSIGITPDGPRGPKYELQEGILFLAAASGAPIIPFHVECEPQRVFEKSWDGHKLPKFFSKVHAMIGEPIYIDKAELKANPEQVKQTVQAAMMANTAIPPYCEEKKK